MSVELKLLIEKTEAALKEPALPPKKKARLERDLAAYRFTAAKADGGDDDDEDDDEDDKAGKAAKKAEASKRKLEAAKHKAKADDHRAKAAECDEAARKAMGDEDDEEDEEAKALRAELAARASLMSEGATAALASQAGQDAAMRARLDAIEKERAAERTANAIAAALTARRITPGEAKTLGTKSAAFVTDFLAMRPKAIVNTDETHLTQPSHVPDADIDPKAMAEIDGMVAKLSISDELKKKVRQDMIDGRRALASGQTNGAPGRY